MSQFIHAMKAEWISGRRTFLRYSPIVFSFATLLLLTPIASKSTGDWMGSVARDVYSFYFGFWIYFVLPMYCVLVAYLSFYTEHSQGLWKQINAQPISGFQQLLVKHVYAWGYLAATLIMLLLFIVLFLFVIKFIYPNLEMGLGNPGFWLNCCILTAGIQVIGMSIVSILIIISTRIRGFTLTFLIGMLGILLPLFIRPADTAATFIPWTVGFVCFFYFWFKSITLEPWWSVHLVWIISFIWIGVSMAIHAVLQKKHPLY